MMNQSSRQQRRSISKPVEMRSLKSASRHVNHSNGYCIETTQKNLLQRSNVYKILALSLTVLLASMSTTKVYSTEIQKKITKENLSTLETEWEFDANLHTPLSVLVGGSGPLLWATNAGIPGIVTLSNDGILYFGDTAGGLYAIDKVSGDIIWQAYMHDYSSPDMPVSATIAQPTVDGSVLYIGSDKHQEVPLCTLVSGPYCQENKGAIVLAINRLTGELIWKAKVDSHPAAKIRGGITVSGNKLIVPVSSWEESYAGNGNKTYITGNPADANVPYPCCSFRGSVVALNKDNGALLWKTYTSPGDNLPDGILETDDKGFYGNAVWIENPIVDHKRNAIYVATGQNYTAPKKAMLCALHLEDPTHYAAPPLPDGITCNNLNTKVGNYPNSIIALNLDTGAILKSFQTRKYDAWNHACILPDFSISYYQPIVGILAPLGTVEANCPRIEDPNNPGVILSMAGPDSGFGHLNLVPRVTIDNADIKKNDDKIKTDLLIAGEKAGTLYAINADNFSLVWKSRVGPGGIIGGLQYGLATDGQYVYTNSTNSSNSGRSEESLSQPRFSHPMYATQNEVQTEYPVGGLYNPIVPNYFSGFDPNYFGGPRAYSSSGVGLIAKVDGVTVEPDNTMINTGKRDWALINPPSDDNYPLVDGVATYIDPDDHKIRTRTSFFSKVDIRNGEIIWQRPVVTDGAPPMQSPWMNSFWDPTHTTAYQGCNSIPILANGMLIANCSNSETQYGLIALNTDNGKIISVIPGVNTATSNYPIVDGDSIYVPSGIHIGVLNNPNIMYLFFGFPGTYGGLDFLSHKLYKLSLPK